MKRYLCALSLLSIGIAAAAQSDIATASWKSQPPVIDGNLNEWNLPLRFYDADTQLFFDIANDSSTLYLCFESKDEMSQMKLMRAGMKITLSTKGKEKHEASILYPVAAAKGAAPGGAQEKKEDEGTNAMDEATPHDRSSFRARFIRSHSVMTVEGFTTLQGQVPLADSTGLTAALNWDSASNLGYEIAIPKKEFFGASYTDKDITAADINLSVTISALPRSASGSDDKSNHPHGGMHGGGGEGGERRGQFTGGGYNSGTEGGRNWNGGEANVSLDSKSSFKQKFVLAKAGS